MISYIFRRVFQMIPTLIGVSILCFIIIHSVPGDPASIMAGTDATQEQIEDVRKNLGLDHPLYEQYKDYMWNLLHGDMGKSLNSQKPVLKEIMIRLPNTVLLTIFSIIITVIIGIFAGVVSATKPNSKSDNIMTMFSLFGISMPVFWFGIMLILIFSYYIPILPSGGSKELKSYILPSIALGLSSSAVLARLTRSSLLEVINQDFIRTAKAKGVKKRLIIYKHALKNAMVPIVTIIGLELGSLLGGAVITETVFSINGLGKFIIQSIQFRDFPAIQGSILFVATILVVVNLIVDISYAALDPRIRYD